MINNNKDMLGINYEEFSQYPHFICFFVKNYDNMRRIQYILIIQYVLLIYYFQMNKFAHLAKFCDLRVLSIFCTEQSVLSLYNVYSDKKLCSWYIYIKRKGKSCLIDKIYVYIVTKNGI